MILLASFSPILLNKLGEYVVNEDLLFFKSYSQTENSIVFKIGTHLSNSYLLVFPKGLS